MASISRIHLAAITLVLASVLGACRQDEPVETPTPLAVPFQGTISDSLVAATVEFGGKVDTLSAGSFRENLNRLQALFPEVMQDEARSLPIRQEMVRQYVLEQLLMQEAQRRGLKADSAMAAAEIERYRSRFDTEEDFLRELEEIHQTESDLRSQFMSTISRDALIQSIEDSLPRPSVEEVEEFRKSLATRLRVQHILIGVPEEASPDDLEASRKRATQLVDSLASGQPFAMLARKHSDDPGSRVSGGELPWFRRGEMVPEFEKAAFELVATGDMTKKPVRTAYGYHLIRLLDRQEDNAISADSALVLLTKRRVRAAHEELQRRLVSQTVVRTNPAFVPPPATPLPSDE